MTKVIQYNDFSCLPACLESFFKDNQRQFDHKQFVKDNLDIFHGGECIEGACDSDYFAEVAKRAGLKFETIPPKSGATMQSPGETIIFATNWKGKTSDKHAVRFCQQHLP
jgi:hypothetical protein